MSCSAIFGKAKFGVAYFGDVYCITNTAHNTYKGKLIGMSVSKSIGKALTYAMRSGNGYIGSKKGRIYQDRYPYFVPSTITHPNGDASRSCFATGMAIWSGFSCAEKRIWERKANRIGGMKGHNLFIKGYMKKNYSP